DGAGALCFDPPVGNVCAIPGGEFFAPPASIVGDEILPHAPDCGTSPVGAVARYVPIYDAINGGSYRVIGFFYALSNCATGNFSMTFSKSKVAPANASALITGAFSVS